MLIHSAASLPPPVVSSPRWWCVDVAGPPGGKWQWRVALARLGASGRPGSGDLTLSAWRRPQQLRDVIKKIILRDGTSWAGPGLACREGRRRRFAHRAGLCGGPSRERVDDSAIPRLVHHRIDDELSDRVLQFGGARRLQAADDEAHAGALEWWAGPWAGRVPAHTPIRSDKERCRNGSPLGCRA